MGSKARKANDLLKDLDDLGIEDVPSSTAPSTKPGASTTANGEDEDVFGDIEKQLATKKASGNAAASSRPETPRMSSSTTSATLSNNNKSAVDFTPSSSSGPPSGRTSEDRLGAAEKGTSGEQRSYHQGSKPGEGREDDEEVPLTEEVDRADDAQSPSTSGGGSWWGWGSNMVSAARSAAVKQAETFAKEIRSNEDAVKWAQQVREYGASYAQNLQIQQNLSNLQNLSTDLRSRALPTFTSLMSHIAPPISAHERLQIHITHDIQNYPSLDPLVYETFARVMAQVEGGDLLVIQRGSENRSRARADSELQGYRGGMLSSGNRWTDGPWWRDEHAKRDIGAVPGLREGTRLARVSAESYAKEFFDARGGVEEVAKQATQILSESNPVRSSNIFLAIQAIVYPVDVELFSASSAAAQQSQDDSATPTATVVDPEDEAEQLVCFAIHLHDPLHSLSFSSLSQPFPQKWASWLDAAPPTSQTATGDGEVATSEEESALPESVMEIIHAGGVDPREWVAEWMEEVLGLAVGVIAQRYVARRMGVGEGAIGRSKKKTEEEGVGGEAARAI